MPHNGKEGRKETYSMKEGRKKRRTKERKAGRQERGRDGRREEDEGK
jgi:hypothetical protein